MSDIHLYLSAVNTSIVKQDGRVLSYLVNIPVGKMSMSSNIRQLAERAKVLNIMAYCASNIANKDLAGVIAKRLLTLIAILSKDWSAAYQHELSSYNALLDCFKDETSNWLIPVLTRIMNDLRLLAIQADNELKQRDNEFLKDAQMKLTNCFTMVAKDRTPVSSPNSKRLAVFAVTNVLFKIYFKLNTLQLCGKLINVVERAGFIESLSFFPVSDVVTYKYYIGRLKMFEDRYEDARDCLSFALRHTPLSAMRDRQRILVSLVPVQLCLGILPSEEVDRRYQLPVLFALGQAVRRGDVRSFEQVMSQYQRSFIRMGIFLVLEQVKVIVHRNLFKRIFLIKGHAHLWLGVFESVLQYLGEDMDLDEIECVVANLIFDGKIKGYISHQRRHLILSKVNPFPSNAIIKIS